MKLIRYGLIKDFHILWLWRISLIYCNNVEDKRKCGIWKTKNARLIFLGKYGIGIGHSIGFDNDAYKLINH